MTTIDMTKIDEEKLGIFMGQAVVDMATTIIGTIVVDRREARDCSKRWWGRGR
ncbi:MAG: hypothetical protein WKF73_10655 [Nocardioidaceae bacterium]